MADAYKVHELKCWPEPFEEMRCGRKTAEYRLNDRGYQKGDMLVIREWRPDLNAFTGREISRKITHILSEGFGLPEGYAMLSLEQPSMRTAEDATKALPILITMLRKAGLAKGEEVATAMLDDAAYVVAQYKRG